MCDTAFAEKSKINGQIESVHEEKKPFRCNDCGTAFSKIHCGYSVSMLAYITLTTEFTIDKNL